MEDIDPDISNVYTYFEDSHMSVMANQTDAEIEETQSLLLICETSGNGRSMTYQGQITNGTYNFFQFCFFVLSVFYFYYLIHY